MRTEASESWKITRNSFGNTKAARHIQNFRQVIIDEYKSKRLTLGALSAIASTRVLTIPALMLNKSSLVIPGLRGTPAGMITRSTSFNAAASSEGPVKADT